MDRLAVFFGRHRALLGSFVLAFTLVSLLGMGRLTFDNDPLKLLKSEKIQLKWLDDDFAHLERTTLIVVEGDDLLAPEAIDVIRKITRGAAAVEGVEAVYSMLSVRDTRRVGRYLLPLFPGSQASPAEYRHARRLAGSHPLLIGHFLSKDLKTSLVIVQFDARVNGYRQVQNVVEQLRATLGECTEASGLRARITGTAALQVEVVESMRRDIFKFSFLGASLAVLIALAMFRRPGAVLLVAIGPVVGTVWTMGTLAWIGEPINMLTNVLPVLVLVIGFTDSMHLVLHVRRVLAAGSSGLEAAQSAIRHLGLACVLTSLSTAVGFGSLLLASLAGIRIFGWCCALGSVLSLLAVLMVVPLLASTPLSKYVVAAETSGGQSLGLLADRILSLILRRPRVVLACAAVVMLALALLATRLEPDHTIAAEIPHSSQAYQALEHVDKTFGGVMFAYAVVRWPEGRGLGSQELYDVLEEVHQVFERSPVLSNPLSVLNLVRSLPGQGESLPRRAAQLRYLPEELLRRLVSLDRRQAVVSAHMPDAGARVLKPAFNEVDGQFAQIERRHPGFHVELVGASVTAMRSVHLMIEDLWKSLLSAAGVMFLMIWIGLWSLRYALVSVMPNVFPLLCTGAFIVLSGGYLEMSSVIVFSISLGIAVDDTIHFLVRFKQEISTEGDCRSAVHRTFRVVGRALVMTTVALVAGHAIVTLSSFPMVRTFGMLTAITLAAALLGDLVILPATVACLKWPRRPPAGTAPHTEDSWRSSRQV